MTYAVIWIDHKEARIFHVHPEAADENTILSPQHHVHRHPKGRGEAREHPDDAHRFFDDIARELDGVDAILIVGPSSAKLEFFKFVHEHHRPLESKVVGIETADHPTGERSLPARGSTSRRATEWAVLTLGIEEKRPEFLERRCQVVRATIPAVGVE
jgi:stalled ribosome rescue protein Dom34